MTMFKDNGDVLPSDRRHKKGSKLAQRAMVFSVCTTLLYGSVAQLPSPIQDTRRVVYTGVACLSMLQLLLGCLLIYGIFWKKPRWMIPWVVFTWTLSVVLLVLSVLGAVLVIIRAVSDEETEAEVSTMVSVYFIYAVLLYYFTSAVESRRGELVKDDSTDSAQRLMRQREYLKHAAV